MLWLRGKNGVVPLPLHTKRAHDLRSLHIGMHRDIGLELAWPGPLQEWFLSHSARVFAVSLSTFRDVASCLMPTAELMIAFTHKCHRNNGPLAMSLCAMISNAWFPHVLFHSLAEVSNPDGTVGNSEGDTGNRTGMAEQMLRRHHHRDNYSS